MIIIDYIGAGTSPLNYAEFKSLLNYGATIRLLPIVYLHLGSLKTIQTYDHYSLLKDFNQFIIPNSEKLKDSFSIQEWGGAFF
jgi:hypothetical protein